MAKLDINTGIPITEDNLGYVEGRSANNTATLNKDGQTVNLAGEMKGAFQKQTGFTAGVSVNPETRLRHKPEQIQSNWQSYYNDGLMNVAEIFNNPQIAMWQNYLSIEDVIISLFEYEGLPTELDTICLEQKLIRSGSIAIIQTHGVYQAVNYTVNKSDIYNRPLVIKVNEPRSLLIHNKLLKDGEFAIINHRPSGLGLFNQIIRPLANVENAYYALEREVKRAGTHLFITNDANTAGNSTTAGVIETNMLSGQHVHEVSAQFASRFRENSLIFETTKTLSELQNAVQFYKSELKECIGLDVQFQKKQERLVVGEVDTQQGLTQQTSKVLLDSRLKGLEDVNRVFNTNWTVILTIETDDDKEEEGEVNNDE